MLNFNQEVVTPEQVLCNQRSIAAHIDDDHYCRRFTPDIFALSGGSATAIIPAAGPRWPAVTFPDASTTRAAVSWDKPSEWRSGKLSFWVWYTAEAGSTANFRTRIEIDAVRSSEVLPGTSLYSVLVDLPGPAVASTVLRVGPLYTTASFGSDDELLTFAIRRNGADASDTNTNELQLLYVKIVHIPAQRESQ